MYSTASGSAQGTYAATNATWLHVLGADLGRYPSWLGLLQLRANLHGQAQLSDLTQNVRVERAINELVSDTKSLASEVNSTVKTAMTQALTAVGDVADIFETGMSALEGMESLLGEHTMVTASSLHSVFDAVQQVLAQDQMLVDELQEKMEQRLMVLHHDIYRLGMRAVDSVRAARNSTLALGPSAQSRDGRAKQVHVALATISSGVQHLQAALADGCISFEQAASAVSVHTQAESIAAAPMSTWRYIFEQVDEDDDGCISKAEWTHAVGPPLPSSPQHVLLERRASARAASRIDRTIALDHILWAKRADSSCSRAKEALLVAKDAETALVGEVRQTNRTLLALLDDAARLSSSMFAAINNTIENEMHDLPSATLPKRAFEPIHDSTTTALAVSVTVTRTLSKLRRTVLATLDQSLDGPGTFIQHFTENLKSKMGHACDLV